MNSPAIICPDDRKLFQGLKNRRVAVITTDLERVKNAAAEVAQSGNSLLNIIIEMDSLDQIVPQEDWRGIPIVLAPKSFGAFRNLEHHIDLIRKLGITVHLPCDTPENITGLKILSSLGIHTTAIMGTANQDWDSLCDLAAYALLSPASHAPIEPFDYIAQHYHPSRYIDWDFLYFNDPKRFLPMNKKGGVLNTPSDGKNQRYRIDKKSINADHVCHRCAGLNICHGRFVDGAQTRACADFFLDLIDSIQRSKQKNKMPECNTGTDVSSGTCQTPVVPDELIPDEPEKAESNGTTWIDLKGGAADALVLSSVLKQVIEKYPSRRYAIVSRTHHDPLLKGHPAVLQSGYPPKDAKTLHVDLLSSGISSASTPYQIITHALGLKIPVEETLYVPWKFEDDPVLLTMVPRKEKNVLIVAGNKSSQDILFGEWEALVHMLVKDNVSVVQAGHTKDGYIREAYDIRGLLQSRQLICLPRHFSVVVTADILMLYAARLCDTPAIILTGPGRILPKYDGQTHVQNPRARAIYNAVKKVF